MLKNAICLASIAVLALVGFPAATALAATLRPNDPSVSGNLAAWFTDPADRYDGTADVWTDGGPRNRDLSKISGFGGLTLSTATPGAGLLAGQTIDVLTSTGSDLLGTPALNEGAGFSQMTLIALNQYPSNNNDQNRPVGIGSFRVTGGGQRPYLNQTADGTIRRDDGFVGGGSNVPPRYFVRGTVLDGDGSSDAPLKDFYFDDTGGGFTATTNLDTSYGRVATGNDFLYIGDVRRDDPGGNWVQVAVYDTALSDAQISEIAQWMGENANAPPGILLSTGFEGRTVSGDTANNITWQTDGLADPGSLTAIDVNSTGSLAGLFDTSNAQGHFAPNLNIGNEGPWSTTVPLALVEDEVLLEQLVIDFQDFDNGGDFQSTVRGKDYTVTVTGSSSGLLDTVAQTNVSGLSGGVSFAFSPNLWLDKSETYDLRIRVAGTNSDGNNSGFDNLTLYGLAVPEPATLLVWSLLAAMGVALGWRRRR